MIFLIQGDMPFIPVQDEDDDAYKQSEEEENSSNGDSGDEVYREEKKSIKMKKDKFRYQEFSLPAIDQRAIKLARRKLCIDSSIPDSVVISLLEAEETERQQRITTRSHSSNYNHFLDDDFDEDEEFSSRRRKKNSIFVMHWSF